MSHYLHSCQMSHDTPHGRQAELSFINGARYIYIYIYIYRQAELSFINGACYIYIYMYMYMHMYIFTFTVYHSRLHTRLVNLPLLNLHLHSLSLFYLFTFGMYICQTAV